MTGAGDKIRVGISSCLVGQLVRYDGQHQLDQDLVEALSQRFELFPVCPEYEVGLGVPREPIRLEGDPEAPRLVTVHTRVDLTDRMNSWAAARVTELAAEGLGGFVFKSKSPSSGLVKVKVFDAKGDYRESSVGLFARAFTVRFPRLPVADELQLRDPEVRRRFIEQVNSRAVSRTKMSAFARGGPPPRLGKKLAVSS